MSDEPVPNEPTQNIERGALTDIALIVASVGGAVQAIKTSVEAGGAETDRVVRHVEGPTVMTPFDCTLRVNAAERPDEWEDGRYVFLRGCRTPARP